MLKLKGGPAEGTYLVKRAPQFLRGVVNAGGLKDVLDQPGDKPEEGETVAVYQRIGEISHIHLRMADRRKTGFYVCAEYVWMPDVEAGTVKRTSDWEAWFGEDGHV
jgi:hypothetical protein